MSNDEVDSYNMTSVGKARENVPKGLTIWGDPLPHKPKQ
jgi:hypothetical protein